MYSLTDANVVKNLQVLLGDVSPATMSIHVRKEYHRLLSSAQLSETDVWNEVQTDLACLATELFRAHKHGIQGAEASHSPGAL